MSARPVFTKPLTIQCEVSSYVHEAVFNEEGDEGEHPIYYIAEP